LRHEKRILSERRINQGTRGQGDKGTSSGSGTAGGGYARDALEVFNEFDLVEAGCGEERFDVGLLAEAEFEDEVSAGNKGGVSGGDEPAIDFEAVATAEEGDVGLVFADFNGDEGVVGVGNVGRVGGDDFELFASDGGEEVALEETDIFGFPETFGIQTRDFKCTLGDVDCGDVH
jgi:hypothetical protein